MVTFFRGYPLWQVQDIPPKIGKFLRVGLGGILNEVLGWRQTNFILVIIDADKAIQQLYSAMYTTYLVTLIMKMIQARAHYHHRCYY